jgi:hypothetical protein
VCPVDEESLPASKIIPLNGVINFQLATLSFTFTYQGTTHKPKIALTVFARKKHGPTTKQPSLKGHNMNVNQPLQTLLAANTSKTEAAQNLGATYDTLTKALDEYKDAFATATKTGWAKNDLLRAGFADPAKLRLPREKKTSTNETEAN